MRTLQVTTQLCARAPRTLGAGHALCVPDSLLAWPAAFIVPSFFPPSRVPAPGRCSGAVRCNSAFATPLSLDRRAQAPAPSCCCCSPSLTASKAMIAVRSHMAAQAFWAGHTNSCMLRVLPIWILRAVSRFLFFSQSLYLFHFALFFC